VGLSTHPFAKTIIIAIVVVMRIMVGCVRVPFSYCVRSVRALCSRTHVRQLCPSRVVFVSSSCVRYYFGKMSEVLMSTISEMFVTNCAKVCSKPHYYLRRNNSNTTKHVMICVRLVRLTLHLQPARRSTILMSLCPPPESGHSTVGLIHYSPKGQKVGD
jgi:hypothetical protein